MGNQCLPGLLAVGDAASPHSCPVSNRLLVGPAGQRVTSLEVTLAFNLFRFSTSDTLYLQSQVTLL